MVKVIKDVGNLSWHYLSVAEIQALHPLQWVKLNLKKLWSETEQFPAVPFPKQCLEPVQVINFYFATFSSDFPLCHFLLENFEKLKLEHLDIKRYALQKKCMTWFLGFEEAPVICLDLLCRKLLSVYE